MIFKIKIFVVLCSAVPIFPWYIGCLMAHGNTRGKYPQSITTLSYLNSCSECLLSDCYVLGTVLGPREWKARACTRAQQLVGKENNYMSGIKEPHKQGGRHFHHTQYLSSQFWYSRLLPYSRIQMPRDFSGSYVTWRTGFIQSIMNRICDLLWN